MMVEEEMGPTSTEEVVLALLEYLVEPLLPPRTKLSEPLPFSHQQCVAKQVHAVVLLYNYYHRKLQPHLEFLAFDSFCKLVVVLKPVLMAYMKLMHQSGCSKVDDLERNLSPIEKAIMDACDISTSLDPSEHIPHTDGWPITKVAVLLVDSRMQNCLLLHDTVAPGVWSFIEKDLDVANINCDNTMEGKCTNKRKRTLIKPLGDDCNTDARLQQLAILAVKETTDIDQNMVTVLESHVVYSLSKEMTAARFYVMQCNQSTSEDLQVPIKDAIASLQGPLVKKTSRGWVVTPVVEYFRLLPYATIFSDWISRAGLSNSCCDWTAKLGHGHVKDSHGVNYYYMTEEGKDNTGGNDGLIGSISNKESNSEKESSEHRKSNHYQTTCLPNQADSSLHRETGGSPINGSQTEDKVSSPGSKKHVSTIGSKTEVDSVNLCISTCRDKNIATENKINTISSSTKDDKLEEDCVPVQSRSQYLANLQAAFASKENLLSDTALKALLRKREELSCQMHDVEDKIARCDQLVQTILNDGENSLALKIDVMTEACNDVCLKELEVQDGKQHSKSPDFSQNVKRKQLSDAVLTLLNPCQKLDAICHRNNWILPTYDVDLLQGGFLSTVSLKGWNFEVSVVGDIRSSPREARESASANLIAKLEYMACQSK